MQLPTRSEIVEASRGLLPRFPELYVNANALQRKFNLRVLDKLQGSFERPPDASQQFADLGCGTGRFTLHQLLPSCLPCRRIVATDISAKMVRYAKRQFVTPQIEYVVHDISDNSYELLEDYGKFDRVYSFLAMHLVNDQLRSLQNVSDLLVTGGECLLLFVARCTGFNLWRRVVQMDRWTPYSGICELYIPRSQDFKEHGEMIAWMTDLLRDVNLEPKTCEILTEVCTDEDAHETILVNVASVPILPLLPKTSRSLFRQDLTNVIQAFWAEKKAKDVQYFTDMYVIHATKLEPKNP